MAAEAAKDGKELFRELLSLYPSACYEDYYKPPGVWSIETLEIDLELLHAHRKEAGAPEPTPLEEVEMPELPKSNPQSGLAAAQAAAAAMRGGGMVKPLASGLGKPAVPGQLGGAIRPVGKPLVAAAKPAAVIAGTRPAAAGADGSGPSAELKQIVLFIQRWKLEATKAKLLLARLTPTRRRWVMSNYRGVSTLEAYIQTCDRTNAWEGAADAPAAAGAGVAAARAAYGQGGAAAPAAGAGGVKRPLGVAGAPAAGTHGPSKMPRLVGSITPASPAKAGPKPPGAAPPAGLVRGGIAAAAKPTATPGGAAGPSWAGKPGSYGVRPAAKPAAVKPAAPKPAGPRPAAAKPLAARPASAGPTYGRPAGYGAGGAAAGGYGQPARPQPAKAGVIRPAAPKPVGAAGSGFTRPTAKVGPPKAKAAEKPGSLIKSLLKTL